jgi:hypothetical protein
MVREASDQLRRRLEQKLTEYEAHERERRTKASGRSNEQE